VDRFTIGNPLGSTTFCYSFHLWQQPNIRHSRIFARLAGFVPALCNPADLVSRGCKLSELTNSAWFHGPKFLSNPQTLWPPDVHGNLDMEVVTSEKWESAFPVQWNIVLEALRNMESHQSGLRLAAKANPSELWDALITDLFFTRYMIIYYLEHGSLV